jgi:hypothetical protein
MLPMAFLTLRSAVAGVPTAVESSLLRTVRAPSRLLNFLLGVLDASLLLELALVSDFVDDPALLLLKLQLEVGDVSL